MIELARRIIADNGFRDRLTLDLLTDLSANSEARTFVKALLSQFDHPSTLEIERLNIQKHKAIMRITIPGTQRVQGEMSFTIKLTRDKGEYDNELRECSGDLKFEQEEALVVSGYYDKQRKIYVIFSKDRGDRSLSYEMQSLLPRRRELKLAIGLIGGKKRRSPLKSELEYKLRQVEDEVSRLFSDTIKRSAEDAARNRAADIPSRDYKERRKRIVRSGLDDGVKAELLGVYDSVSAPLDFYGKRIELLDTNRVGPNLLIGDDGNVHDIDRGIIRFAPCYMAVDIVAAHDLKKDEIEKYLLQWAQVYNSALKREEGDLAKLKHEALVQLIAKVKEGIMGKKRDLAPESDFIGQYVSGIRQNSLSEIIAHLRGAEDRYERGVYLLPRTIKYLERLKAGKTIPDKEEFLFICYHAMLDRAISYMMHMRDPYERKGMKARGMKAIKTLISDRFAGYYSRQDSPYHDPEAVQRLKKLCTIFQSMEIEPQREIVKPRVS